jgi:hypothetical protein
VSLFGRDSSVTTTFNAKDNMSPVVRGIRRTMDDFKRDAKQGFGIAAGISVFTAAGKAIDFAGDALRAYADEQVSVAKLTTALNESAEAWDGNTDAIEAVIRSRMRLGFSDDEQRNSLALLVAQVRNVNDALAIQRTAMDLARLRGISLAEASTLLAKAYNGSATGLQRMGIQVRRGARGMEALGDVQTRVAGQAKAYAETTRGAMEVSAIAFDEFKESVGGALNDALQPFFKLVVDLTNQTPDLDTTVGKLTQAYRDQIEATKQLNEEGQKQGDIFYDIYSFFAPQDRAIHDFTGTLGDYARILGVSRKELALFTEAGLTAGKTLPQLRQVLDSLVEAQVADRIKDIGYAWQTGMDSMGAEAQKTGAAIYGGLVRPTRRAMRDMFATADDAKGPWKAAMKSLAEAGKDPFSDEKFAGWMRRKAREFVRNARREYRQGKGDNRAAAQALAYVMTNPILVALANTQEEIEALANAAAVILDIQGRIGGFRRNGSTGKNPNAQVGPTGGINVGNNAMGGYIGPGERSLVGENGPEIIEVAGGGGLNVTPNHRMGQPINVYVDGQRLFRILDARTGRAVAMGG